MKRHWTLSLLLSIAIVGLAGCGSTQVAENGDGTEEQVADGTPPADAAKEDSGGFSLPWSGPKTEKFTVPAGTALQVRTTSTISTQTAKSGEAFAASLAEPIVVNGRVVMPEGTPVEGFVVTSDEGGRVKGTASLTLRLSEARLNSGSVELDTGSVTRAAPATKKKDAVKIGVVSGIGAAIGAIAGGGEGAAIGAASGAGAGTGVVLATRGDPAVIGAESLLTFELRNPITVELETK